MNTEPKPSPQRRYAGSRVVIVSILLALLVTVYVVIRIVQVSGPGPDPKTIPERPRAETG